MHIAIAPFHLKAGVTEDDLLAASDVFQREFVADHPGVVRRVVVRRDGGGYADVVFFADPATVERVMAAEQESEVCRALFSLLDDGGAPAMYEVLQVHEQ